MFFEPKQPKKMQNKKPAPDDAEIYLEGAVFYNIKFILCVLRCYTIF